MRVLMLALMVPALVSPAGCGDAAPAAEAQAAVRLVDLAGTSVQPLADMKSPVAVFLFVRTDCPISNRYAPRIRSLQERFGSRGVLFYLVYPDPQQSAEAIAGHVKEYELPCEPLRDPRHELVELTGATITPEAAVFVPPGRMVYRGRIDDRYVSLGQTRAAPTRNDLEDAIAAALDGRPIEPRTTKAVGCIIADLK